MNISEIEFLPGVSLERVVRCSGLGEATHVLQPDFYLLSSVCRLTRSCAVTRAVRCVWESLLVNSAGLFQRVIIEHFSWAGFVDMLIRNMIVNGFRVQK